MKNEYPILESDNNEVSLIDPLVLVQPIDDMPTCCVMPIYHQVIEILRPQLEEITCIYSTMGKLPVYRMDYNGQSIAVVNPGMCAPFAAGCLEELIAFGCRKFVACGSCGVLDESIPKGTVFIPEAAVRDEGTSYHYVPAAREIAMQQHVVQAMEAVLQNHQVHFMKGKTWTTDAIYRETKSRIARRKQEGCLTVEMECSALLAVAQFRNVKFGQLLSAGDDVSGDVWDPRQREKHLSSPERLFWLATEACVLL